jgi:hypothetical protein
LCAYFDVFLEENLVALRNIWFSDEIQFNWIAWASEHPHNVMETTLRPEKWTVWCSLSTSGILAHTIDNTLPADHYLHALQEFLPFH